jgi:hypothetical protein
MKKLKALTMVMALVGVFFLAACGNGNMGDSSSTKNMMQVKMKKGDNMNGKGSMNKDKNMGSGNDMEKK